MYASLAMARASSGMASAAPADVNVIAQHNAAVQRVCIRVMVMFLLLFGKLQSINTQASPGLVNATGRNRIDRPFRWCCGSATSQYAARYGCAHLRYKPPSRKGLFPAYCPPRSLQPTESDEQQAQYLHRRR